MFRVEPNGAEKLTSEKQTSFLALLLGELSSKARLRGRKSGSFFEGAVSLLTEGVTYLPFPTLLPLLYPNVFSHKLKLYI